MVQQEWGRAHAKVAERKAGHGWGMMEEDVFAAAKRGRVLTETRGARRGKDVVKWRGMFTN